MLFISYYKALLFLKIFAFFSWNSGYVEKQLDKKAKVNFKIYDVTDWKTNNYKTENEARRVVPDLFLLFF